MRVFALLVLFLIATFPAKAAMPIEVVTAANDPVGRQVAFAIKENLKNSPSFVFSYDKSAARMQAHIATLANAETAGADPGTVFSVVVTWYNPEQPFPFYLTQYAGRCTTEHIQDCANDVVARISDKSDEIIGLLVNRAGR